MPGCFEELQHGAADFESIVFLQGSVLVACLRFLADATFAVEINTTGTVQPWNGYDIDPGFRLEISGSMEFVGFAYASGSVMLRIENGQYALEFESCTFDLGPIDITDVSGGASVYTGANPGIVLKLAVPNFSVDVMSVFTIDAAASSS